MFRFLFCICRVVLMAEGIPQPHLTGAAAVQSLFKGESDLAISSDTPFVLAVLNGEKLTMPASRASSSRNNVIIARKDRGGLLPGNLKTVRNDVADFTCSEQTVFNKACETITFRLVHDAALLVSIEDPAPIRHA